MEPGSTAFTVKPVQIHTATASPTMYVMNTVSGGASRMYYDTREMVVSFPRLQVGDVVEVKYRVDDVAQRNAFADYFGDLEIFQSDTPRASVRSAIATWAASPSSCGRSTGSRPA